MRQQFTSLFGSTRAEPRKHGEQQALDVAPFPNAPEEYWFPVLPREWTKKRSSSRHGKGTLKNIAIRHRDTQMPLLS
jgi:hypothetical protein